MNLRARGNHGGRTNARILGTMSCLQAWRSATTAGPPRPCNRTAVSASSASAGLVVLSLSRAMESVAAALRSASPLQVATVIDLTKSRHYYDYHREMEALMQAGIPGDALPQYYKVRTAACSRVRRVRHNAVRRPSHGTFRGRHGTCRRDRGGQTAGGQTTGGPRAGEEVPGAVGGMGWSGAAALEQVAREGATNTGPVSRRTVGLAPARWRLR